MDFLLVLALRGLSVIIVAFLASVSVVNTSFILAQKLKKKKLNGTCGAKLTIQFGI